MDSGTAVLDAATAFNAALGSFLSRLTVGQQPMTDVPGVREGLWELAVRLADWRAVAEDTDAIMRRWADGHLVDDTAVADLLRTAGHQFHVSGTTAGLLRGISPSDRREFMLRGPQSLRNLAGSLSPDLRDQILAALDQRRAFVAPLIAELPGLRLAGHDSMREVSSRLHLASEELDQASGRLEDWVSEHFPAT